MTDATPLDTLGLSDRTLYSLKRAGITRVGEALSVPESELLKIRNFGQKSLDDLHRKLAHNHSLSDGIYEDGDISLEEDDSGDEQK